MYILITLISLTVGFTAGFVVSLIFRQRRNYSGVMKVIREDDRILYSLELQEDPIMLENMSEVVFKVETSDESSDRK